MIAVPVAVLILVILGVGVTFGVTLWSRAASNQRRLNTVEERFRKLKRSVEQDRRAGR